VTPLDLFFEQRVGHTQLRQGVGLFSQFLFELLSTRWRKVGRLGAMMTLAFQPSQGRTFNGAFDGAQIIHMHPVLTQDLPQRRIRQSGGQV
jgi:hypothetical protein